jgi:tricorn protease
MIWSPDSEKLLFHDAALNLYWVDAGSGKINRIDQSESGEIGDYAWSPDSRWVAYAMAEVNNFRSLFLHDIKSGKTTRVTTDFTDESDPAFDPTGKYLYFVSSRHFNPTIAGYDLKPVWTHQDGLYLVTLAADEPNPLAPESDEVGGEDEDDNADSDGAESDDKAKDEKSGQEEEKEIPETKIDLDGIGDRIVDLGVDPGNYYDLTAGEGQLFFMSRPLRPGGGRGNRRAASSLMVYGFEDREAKTVLEKADGYALAASGEKILYASDGSFGIIDAGPDQKPAEKPLRVDEMVARVDPRAEWQQIFRDAWRLERDFFYDPGMHGTDWEDMSERYGQIVPYVAHRSDLDYLLGELIGELNSSHSYVRGTGDNPEVASVRTGLLGCDFVLDTRTNRYRLQNILVERDWNRDQRTPLHSPGNEVANGEFLLAVDGVELVAPMNPYALLEGKVDQQVLLTVGSDAGGKDSRDITVEPIGSESGLRYEAWVQANRRKVAEMSDGKIGYIHVPNTAVAGQQNFAKGYYPQLRKEGLIIDERFNGGGFVPDFFTTILSQKLVNLWKPRYGQNWRTPGTAFLGHLAMLINGYAGSGGDAFPYYFKFYELGPVIGMRTWGGLVGVSRGIPLIDGGMVTFPEFAFFNVDGEWEVENYGVEPTLPIDNLPHEVIDGKDPQLEKAVEVLLQKIEGDPVEVPEHGSFPRDKTR